MRSAATNSGRRWCLCPQSEEVELMEGDMCVAVQNPNEPLIYMGFVSAKILDNIWPSYVFVTRLGERIKVSHEHLVERDIRIVSRLEDSLG